MGFINQLTTGGHHHVGRSTNGGSSRILMLRLSSPDGENIAVLCQINGANVTWTVCSDPLFFIGQIQDVFSIFFNDICLVVPWRSTMREGFCRFDSYRILQVDMPLVSCYQHASSYWCILRREWMGCWGLLGWLLLVMKWIIPENSLRLAPVSLVAL